MAASQMSIYNKALRWLEERPLASLTENREPRRLLDAEWQDAILYVLSQGYWKHAIRTIQANAEPNQAPNFGYLYAFLKPDDWVATCQVSDNTIFQPLLREYDDQNNYWYSYITPIYVKYVSNAPQFGLNMAMWTPGFVEYLSAYLAQLLAPRIKQAENKIATIDKVVKRLRAQGLSKDAMDLPPGKPPAGTWIMSRAPRGSCYPYSGAGGGFPGWDD